MSERNARNDLKAGVRVSRLGDLGTQLPSDQLREQLLASLSLLRKASAPIATAGASMRKRRCKD